MMGYQMTGVSFASAHELGDFLRGQGFAAASEGYAKVCEVTGDLIEASFTLTRGKAFVTMKRRPLEQRSVRAGDIVRINERGAARVLNGSAGMLFEVANVTDGVRGPVVHVLDLRYPDASMCGGFQHWSIAADGWEPL